MYHNTYIYIIYTGYILIFLIFLWKVYYYKTINRAESLVSYKKSLQVILRFTSVQCTLGNAAYFNCKIMFFTCSSQYLTVRASECMYDSFLQLCLIPEIGDTNA